MLPAEAKEAQAKHPIAWWSLVLAMLTPMAVGITSLGFVLKQAFPAPTLLPILAGGALFILILPPLLLLGAFGWLLLARAFVSRSVARAFCIHPGFGIFSRASEWMFFCVYGREDE